MKKINLYQALLITVIVLVTEKLNWQIQDWQYWVTVILANALGIIAYNKASNDED